MKRARPSGRAAPHRAHQTLELGKAPQVRATPNSPAWPVLDAAREARVLNTITFRGPERLPMMDIVAVVSSVVERKGRQAAAAKFLRRSQGWVSKHAKLGRAQPTTRPWTYLAMADESCADIEVAYLLMLIEGLSPTAAADVYAQLRNDMLARQAAPAGARIYGVSRKTLRAIHKELKAEALPSDPPARQRAARRPASNRPSSATSHLAGC